MAIKGPPPGGSPQVATHALPPERSTRACSRKPRRQSANNIRPKIENAASKLASGTARASPSISRASHRGKGRSRSASRRTMPGAMSVASTAAPRSAAGPLSAPAPAAISSTRADAHDVQRGVRNRSGDPVCGRLVDGGKVVAHLRVVRSGHRVSHVSLPHCLRFASSRQPAAIPHQIGYRTATAPKHRR